MATMSLVVYTARVSYAGPDRFDVTRKSGRAAFAPSWKILGPYLEKRRRGTLGPADWTEYVCLYSSEMRRSYCVHRDEWDALLGRDEVTLCCYCTDPVECHRFVLAVMLVKCGAEYRGERVKP